MRISYEYPCTKDHSLKQFSNKARKKEVAKKCRVQLLENLKPVIEQVANEKKTIFIEMRPIQLFEHIDA